MNNFATLSYKKLERNQHYFYKCNVFYPYFIELFNCYQYSLINDQIQLDMMFGFMKTERRINTVLSKLYWQNHLFGI